MTDDDLCQAVHISRADSDDPYQVGDYPAHHIRALFVEYSGDIGEVVDRLEADGRTPLDIVQGAAR